MLPLPPPLLPRLGTSEIADNIEDGRRGVVRVSAMVAGPDQRESEGGIIPCKCAAALVFMVSFAGGVYVRGRSDTLYTVDISVLTL